MKEIKALANGWFEGEPDKDGFYLRAFDEDEADEDADLFSFRNGVWFKGDAEWFCFGGVWKPVDEPGSLPGSLTNSLP